MEDFSLEQDYYRLLNIPRTATNDEITAAYRNFSRIFHPDKHSTDPNKRKWAEKVFRNIKDAYEALIDEKKRAIYDTMGKHGLEVDGWQVAFRTKTAKEIRDEYEKLQREKEQKMLQQTTNPKSAITLNVNATEFFQSYIDKFDIAEEPNIRDIEISGMNIQQSISAPISISNTVTITGGVSTQNGIGTGNLNVSDRYFRSEDLSMEYEFGIGNGPLFGFKLFKRISRMMFLNTAVSAHFTPHGITPSFGSNISMQMDEKSVGHLSYKLGRDGSSMSSAYIWGSERCHTSTAIQIGSPHSFISLNIMYKFPEQDLKLRIALKYGTFGALLEYGAEKKISKYCKVSAAIAVGVPTGVMLKLKMIYSSQTFTLPILLSDEVILPAIYYGSAIPVISWMVVKAFVLDPIALNKMKKEKERLLEANYERIEQLKSQARASASLMKDASNRIKAEEERNNGLVIVKAIYGVLPIGKKDHNLKSENNDSNSIDECIDVTIPLQCLVKESRLELLAGTKVDLPGFVDTNLGENKHLSIMYKFRNSLHQCTIPDNSVLVLPHKSHRIKNNRS